MGLDEQYHRYRLTRRLDIHLRGNRSLLDSYCMSLTHPNLDKFLEHKRLGTLNEIQLDTCILQNIDYP